MANDLFNMGFDELVNNVNKDVEGKTNEKKEAEAKDSKQMADPWADFDSATAENTNDVKVDPNVFGEVEEDKNAPKEYTKLKDVSHVVPEDTKPTSHGKTFGQTEASTEHGKTFGKSEAEDKPGKEFKPASGEKQEPEKPKSPAKANDKKVEVKPKPEKTKAKRTRKSKKDINMEVNITENSVAVELPVDKRIIDLIGEDDVRKAIEKAAQTFATDSQKELKTAATKAVTALI